MFQYFVEQTVRFVFSMGSDIYDSSVLECCQCFLLEEHFDPLCMNGVVLENVQSLRYCQPHDVCSLGVAGV